MTGNLQVRREKISKRMKYLQNLVPGCNKITGKVGMLDEIINYVQSLQQQVEVINKSTKKFIYFFFTKSVDFFFFFFFLVLIHELGRSESRI